MTMNIRRGDIFYILPGSCVGSEQQAGRPAIIVSNDACNRNSSVVEVVYLTTQPKKDLPTHVTIRSSPKGGTALCEAIYSVSTERLSDYAGHVTNEEMAALEIAMLISLGIQLAGETTRKIPNSITPPRSWRNFGLSSLQWPFAATL